MTKLDRASLAKQLREQADRLAQGPQRYRERALERADETGIPRTSDMRQHFADAYTIAAMERDAESVAAVLRHLADNYLEAPVRAVRGKR